MSLKFAIGLVLALAVPAVACYCYYLVVDLGPARAGWAPLVALSFPVVLVSGAALVAALLAHKRRPWVVRGIGAVLAASGGLLAIAEAHSFGF
ncbi:MAG: hypothetical protein ABJD97_13755 [Betaproteobacteria bacterium]